jgi:hypothetical protein
MLFKNGINLQDELSKFINLATSIVILSPYIKLETLNLLIDSNQEINAVVVRWEPKDLIQGSSDLEVYTYLKAKGIPLFRNARLHLKAYIDNYSKCFLTSANISARALNLPNYSNFNYEIGTIIEHLTIHDRIYFSEIINESTLITEQLYNQIKTQLENISADDNVDLDFKFVIEAPDKDFLISSLPMSFDIEVLYEVYSKMDADNEVDLNCAIHDITLYNLPLGLSYSDFKIKLTESFFSQQFIKRFLDNVDEEGYIYFGPAKRFVQTNCTDVPVPRMWEITNNIQILYRWIAALGTGKYEIDRPNYSERLRLVI